MAVLDIDGTEFGLRVGVHQTTVSGWVLGKYSPTLASALLFPEALEVSPLWLLYGIGQPHDHSGDPDPMEGRASYYRGRLREAMEVEKYAAERLARLTREARQPAAAEMVDTVEQARPAATPADLPVDTGDLARQRKSGINGGGRPRSGGSGA